MTQETVLVCSNHSRVFQILEASRNTSRFVDTIEYTISTHPSGIVFNRVLQSIIEVLQVQLNTCVEVNNRIRVLQSMIESCLNRV